MDSEFLFKNNDIFSEVFLERDTPPPFTITLHYPTDAIHTLEKCGGSCVVYTEVEGDFFQKRRRRRVQVVRYERGGRGMVSRSNRLAE